MTRWKVNRFGWTRQWRNVLSTSVSITGNNIQATLLAFGDGVVFWLFTVCILTVSEIIFAAVFELATYYGLDGSVAIGTTIRR